MNILPFGGIGVWRATYNSKKRKKVMDGVGGVGGSYSGGAAAAVAPTPTDGAASTGAEAPGKVSGGSDGTENAEKFGQGQNINMSQQTSVTNINMSTQDHMCMREMASQGGSQESSGIDIKKLLEMMMALKLLETMSSQGSGQ
jgi:hypothetical protein